jgi:glycosyltransferase involved in cell wall biosynthesis
MPNGAQYSHEPPQVAGRTTRYWTMKSSFQTLRFMQVDQADAVLILGTTNRLPLIYAIMAAAPKAAIIFAADTNYASVAPTHLRDWVRVAAYRALSAFITEGWAMGRSSDDALALLGISRRRALSIYAVDFAELGSPRATPLPLHRKMSLLAVARLAPQKNLRQLIQAISADSLRNRLSLTIVGEGPERLPIEQMIAEKRGVAVTLAGAIPHVRLESFFAEAHALILPSLEEPWGIVVVEALGLGIPVLATPAVGAASSLAGHFHGLLLSEGPSVAALTSALERLLDEYDGLARSAVRESALIRAEFSIVAVADRMATALSELISA